MCISELCLVCALTCFTIFLCLSVYPLAKVFFKLPAIMVQIQRHKHGSHMRYIFEFQSLALKMVTGALITILFLEISQLDRCACMSACVSASLVGSGGLHVYTVVLWHVWESEDNFLELVFSFSFLEAAFPCSCGWRYMPGYTVCARLAGPLVSKWFSYVWIPFCLRSAGITSMHHYIQILNVFQVLNLSQQASTVSVLTH